MDLACAIYQSLALIQEDAKLHAGILQSSRRHNRENRITGFLHREQRYFLQYLEGPTAALEETLDRIRRDRRHTEFTILSRSTTHRRRFPDWQMGFVSPQTFALHDLLEVGPMGLDLRHADPFDLVIFMASNADQLRCDPEPMR